MIWFYFINIYILTIALITKIIKNKHIKNKVNVILGFGLLGFLAMFHSENVGNDIKVYIYSFNVASTLADIPNNFNGYEVGFVWLLKVLTWFSDNPQILIISVGAFAYFSYSRFVYRYSKITWMSTYLFFTLGYFDFSLSGLRQVISTAILLFAYDYIIDKRPWKFMITVFVAALFHNAGWAFMPAYLIDKFKSKKNYMYLIGIITPIITVFFQPVFNIVLKIFPKYTYYLNGELTDGIVRSATILKIIVLLLIICLELLVKNKNTTDVDRTSFLFLVTTLGILVASTKAVAIGRSSQIYHLFTIIYIPNIADKLKSDKDKFFVIVSTIICFFIYAWVIQTFKTPEWQMTYPFSFFWE